MLGKAACIYAKDDGSLKIGKNVLIGRYNEIGGCGDIEIEDNVIFASCVHIIPTNHSYQNVDIPIRDQGGTRKTVLIKKDSWVGRGSIILSGVTIGEHSVIGAGSVVTKDVPDYCVAVGNPAKIIKRYDFENSEWVNIDKNLTMKTLQA